MGPYKGGTTNPSALRGHRSLHPARGPHRNPCRWAWSQPSSLRNPKNPMCAAYSNLNTLLTGRKGANTEAGGGREKTWPRRGLPFTPSSWDSATGRPAILWFKCRRSADGGPVTYVQLTLPSTAGLHIGDLFLLL